MKNTPYLTPYERGNQNQTSTWHECVAWYERLAADFPSVLQFFQIGVSDNGVPLHAGVVSADGVFDRALRVLQQQRHPPWRAGRHRYLHGAGA